MGIANFFTTAAVCASSDVSSIFGRFVCSVKYLTYIIIYTHTYISTYRPDIRHCLAISDRTRVRCRNGLEIMSSMEELQARMSALSEELAVVKGEKRQLKRSRDADLKRSRAAEARAWRLTEPMRRTVLAMYYLADYDAEPAVRYLHSRSRQHQWPAKSDDEILTVVEDIFLRADVAEGAALSDCTSPMDAGVLRVALKQVEEWKVVRWAKQCNEELRVAPSTASLLDRLEENRMKIPEVSRPQTTGNVSMPKARLQARRIRKRWGGRYGATPAGEVLDPEEAREKVRPSILIYNLVNPSAIPGRSCALAVSARVGPGLRV